MKEINMIERSYCGSGGCISCPFSHSEEAEMAQNYGCLPTPQQIVEMKEKSGHNWACHSDETILCGGFAKYIKRNRPDLNINEGQLISYETWDHEGEAKAIQEANIREIQLAKEEIQRLQVENNKFRSLLANFTDEEDDPFGIVTQALKGQFPVACGGDAV
ncbi:hypothetical protein [Bacillus velezensis]|uniref:hypothetical protein n=1 Tax=Bacillus velezensis TaxID=492670 RepID=UPI001C2062DD|nr:hypothetical protein [Bacillus velezensis]